MSHTKPSLPEEPEFRVHATRSISSTQEIPGPSDPIVRPLSLCLSFQLGLGPRVLGTMASMLPSSPTSGAQSPASSLDPDRICFSVCPTAGPSKPFEIMARVSLEQLRVGYRAYERASKTERNHHPNEGLPSLRRAEEPVACCTTELPSVGVQEAPYLSVEGQCRPYSGRALTSSGWTRGVQSCKSARPSLQRQRNM